MLGMVVGETGDAESLYRLVRGSAERVARELRGAHARIEVRAAPIGGFESVAANALDPVGYLVIDENVVGVLGLVNAKALSAAGLDAPIAAAELDWSLLAQGYPPTPRAQPLANSPTLDRDLSVILANNVTWAQLEATVRSAELPHLESISFVGNWRGKKIGDDRKSVTFRLDFRAADRTLRREEIDPHVARLVTILTTQLGGEIRV
jgi:phenylalanyl-tRNA synthetase beta chain